MSRAMGMGSDQLLWPQMCGWRIGVPLCWRRWVLTRVGRGLVPARELNPHGRGQSGAHVGGQRAGTVEYLPRLAQRVFRRAEQSAGDGGVGAGGRDHDVIEDQEQH
jgi:hypothetical protein